MKDKEMIEEMAMICCESDTNCTDCFELNERLLGIKIKNRADHCQAYCYAEKLFKQGYRQIPEDSVVLSREEKQKLLKGMYEQGKFDALADLEKDGKVVLSKEEYSDYLILQKNHEFIRKKSKRITSRQRKIV